MRAAGETLRAALDQERARADAAVASARANEEQSRAEHERLRGEQERLRAERNNQAQAFAAARDLALELDASFNRVRAEVDDLKHSYSWRLMAPLRALYGTMRRTIGRSGS